MKNDSFKKNIQFKKELQTSRLILTTLNETDSIFIKQLTNTEGWLQFIGNRNIYSTTQATEYILKIKTNPFVIYWKVSLKKNLTPIGVITLIKRDYLDYYDIGFAFLPEFSKQGFAFEATKKVLSSSIDLMESKSLLAVTNPKNKRSINLLKKLGMQLSKTIKRDNELLHIYTVSKDKLEIDRITHNFFKIFNNTKNNKPNWESIYKLCIPEILIIKLEGQKQEVYTLENFIEPRKKILENGTLIDFEEFELENDTTIINNLAQRHSTYLKRGIVRKKDFKQKGNKLFQFIKSKNEWKINSIIWEDF